MVAGEVMATLVGRGGGCLVNRYLLVSTMGSVRADADFPPGENRSTWAAHWGTEPLCPHSQATAWAGRHPHRYVASASPAGVTVGVCLVRLLVFPRLW